MKFVDFWEEIEEIDSKNFTMILLQSIIKKSKFLH